MRPALPGFGVTRPKVMSTETNGSLDAVFTKREAAQFLRVTTRTIERLVKAGRLRAYKPTGGLYRLRKSDLDQFLESGATIGGAE